MCLFLTDVSARPLGSWAQWTSNSIYNATSSAVLDHASTLAVGAGIWVFSVLVKRLSVSVKFAVGLLC